jgi:ribosomal protein L40E
MNEDERTAWIHNRAAERLEYGNRIGFHKYHYQEQDLSNDENVLKLLENGYKHYKVLVATRIYSEHKNEFQLNLCPKCNKIARTPWAQQCRFCFHDWHSKDD